MSERIVVIGGGAGGLELVVKLAKKLRREPDTEVMLIDKNATHIWKPLFHEVATGSLNSYHDEASYRMLARKHGFQFVLGRVTGMDLDARTLSLSAVDDEAGVPMVPERTMDYDRLVVAVGSLSNDFGIEGVADFSRALDSREEAERFHRLFTAQVHRVNSDLDDDAKLSVVIVGGGATGVQLAGAIAAAHPRIDVTLIDGEDRLLAAMGEASGRDAERILRERGVDVRLGTEIDSIDERSVSLDGSPIPGLPVWAAGFQARADDFGLPVDDQGRVLVDRFLRVDGWTKTFAAGDIALHTTSSGDVLPMSAQIAVQAGDAAGRNAVRSLRGDTLSRARLGHRGWVLDLGGHRGLAEVGPVTLTAPLLDLIPPALHWGIEMKHLLETRGLAGLLARPGA